MPKGRSANQRDKLLRLREVLLEYTDENNYVRGVDITKHMSNIGISLERKTVYADMDLLMDTEEDIEIIKEKMGKEWVYRVISRDFELSELQLIIDCVQTSKFITQKYANELSEKLKRLTSKYGRATLNRRCFVVDRARNMNNAAFHGIDDIHFAIEKDCKISFKYTVFESPKIKKENDRVVSPVALVWNESNYYLFATNGKRYRVDRMKNVQVLENEPRDGMENYSKTKIIESTATLFTAFKGTPENVQLRFTNGLTSVVIDRFGDKMRMTPLDDTHFSIRVKVEVNAQFYGWLCGLGQGVKILSPTWVVDGMLEHLTGITKRYQSDTNT